MRTAGPYVVVLTTALPDVPLTVTTTYIGADGVDTTAVDLILSRRPLADRATRSLPRDDVPVTHAHDRSLLDHLAQVHSALADHDQRTAKVDVPGAVVDATRSVGSPRHDVVGPDAAS